MRNKSITVATPVAALAVRGTDFWWGPIDGHFGAAGTQQPGRCGKWAGSGHPRQGGYGTDLEQGLSKTKAARGRPYKWPPDKVARPIANQFCYGVQPCNIELRWRWYPSYRGTATGAGDPYSCLAVTVVPGGCLQSRCCPIGGWPVGALARLMRWRPAAFLGRRPEETEGHHLNKVEPGGF
jgi:hypothetical protein